MNQKGFSPLIILLSLAGIVALSAGVYFFISQNQMTSQQTSQISPTSMDDTVTNATTSADYREDSLPSPVSQKSNLMDSTEETINNNLDENNCPCWDGINNTCLPISACI